MKNGAYLPPKHDVIQTFIAANKTKETESKSKDAPRKCIMYEAIKI
jgi:hypothetical protein